MKKSIILAVCVLMVSAGTAFAAAALASPNAVYPGLQTFTLYSTPSYATCSDEAKFVNIKATAAAYARSKGLMFLSYTCGVSPTWTVTAYK